MMRRQRKENIESKGSPVSCATRWIITVILGILFLASLGTAVGLITKDCPCPRCPEQWVTYRGSCYFFSKEKKDWYSSRESCQAQGAHLLVINSTSEMDFLTLHNQSHWIGLQNNTGGGWVWEDGSKLTGKKVLFNSFVQNCVILMDGVFHASSCQIAARWICEKSLQ